MIQLIVGTNLPQKYCLFMTMMFSGPAFKSAISFFLNHCFHRTDNFCMNIGSFSLIEQTAIEQLETCSFTFYISERGHFSCKSDPELLPG